MEMFGKVVSPKKSSLNVNGQPELLINHKSGRITLSNELMSKIGCADGMVGFAYDPAKDLNNAVAFLYVMDSDSDGCKVGKSGAVTSRFHADRLKGAFPTDLSEEANRFKLDVDVKNSIEHSGITVYPITFKEELADITRTRAPHAQVEETPQADSCPSSNHDLENEMELEARNEEPTSIEDNNNEPTPGAWRQDESH